MCPDRHEASPPAHPPTCWPQRERHEAEVRAEAERVRKAAVHAALEDARKCGGLGATIVAKKPRNP